MPCGFCRPNGTECFIGLRVYQLKTYGVMLIGCGYIGLQHVQDIYYRENIRLVAVVDKDESTARLVARKYGAESHGTDYRRYLADDRVDIVIIATYTASHLEILRDCLQYGKHVLCEKPIAATLAEGEAFVQAVKAASSKVLVAHILRHNQTYRKVRELIQSGEIGELRVVRMVQNHHAMDWERYRRLLEDCTPVVDCGVHYIDVLQWFTSSKICEVSGIGTCIDEDSPNLNYTMMTCRLDNGCVGYYEAGWSRHIAAVNTKEFIGTKGRITLELKKQRVSHCEEGDLITVYHGWTGEYRHININTPYKDMYGQLCTLIDMIEHDVPGEPTIDEVFCAFKAAVIAQDAIRGRKILTV